MKQIWWIAQKEFGDRCRNHWVLGTMLIWVVSVTLASAFGLVQMGKFGLHGYDRTVASLISLIQWLVPLLGLLIGHDLIAGDREGRSLRLVCGSGISRSRVLLAKFIGGVLALVLPLLCGFLISGLAIGFSAGGSHLGAFLLLTATGIALGIVFVAAGLCLSVFCPGRGQALVAGLVVWGIAVFAADLAALGIIVVSRTPAAVQEIEIVCDPNHLNASTDWHSVFDNRPDGDAPQSANERHRPLPLWALLSPTTWFRSIHLSRQAGIPSAGTAAVAVPLFWLLSALGMAAAKFSRIDL